MHVHDIAPFGQDAKMDFTHIINKLSFGPPYTGSKVENVGRLRCWHASLIICMATINAAVGLP